MTSGQKTAFSLLITVLIFTAFTVASFMGGFKFIETRFYQQKILQGINEQLDTISTSLDSYLNAATSRFEEYTESPSVKTFAEAKPQDDSVRQRSKLTGDLFAATTGLSGMRVIDRNGRNIHYSTYNSDILKKSDSSISFANYSEDSFPFAKLSAFSRNDEGRKYIINFDAEKNQFIISYPFSDRYSVNRGVIVFYIDCSDFTRFLVSQSIVSLSDSGVLLVSDESASAVSGIVFGIPAVGRQKIEKAVAEKWNAGLYGQQTLLESDNGDWILISCSRSSYARIGWVCNDNIFVFPNSVKMLLLVCVFITIFLLVFLLFNLRHDDMVVIRDRIKKFQMALLTEYVDKKESADWKKIGASLEARKLEVNAQIKKSLGGRAKKHSEEVDALLDRSWDEILSAMGARSSDAGSISFSEQNTQQLKAMLEEVLSKGGIKVNAISVDEARPVEAEVVPAGSSGAQKLDSLKTKVEAKPLDISANIERLNKFDSLSEVEDLEEVEEAEEVEDLEPLEEAAEEVEELSEEIPEAEPVEELVEEPAEEVEELTEEIPEAEPVEELEELSDDDELLEEVPALEVEPPKPFEQAEDYKPSMENLNSFVNGLNDINKDIENEIDLSEKTEFSSTEIAMAPTKEDDEIYNNFTVSSLDFSALDDFILNEDRFVPVTHSDDEEETPDLKNERELVVDADTLTKEQQADLHNVVDEIPADEAVDVVTVPSEELTGAETEIPEEAEKTEEAEQVEQIEPVVVETERPSFAVEQPDVFIPKKKKGLLQLARESSDKNKAPVKHRGLLAAAEKAEGELQNNAGTLEPVKNKNSFGFTAFGSRAQKVEELNEVKDAIEEHNGIYSITANLSTAGVKVDPEFKKLVDSVIGK